MSIARRGDREPIVWISPPKYVQGPDALDRYGELAAIHGERQLVVATAGGRRRLGDRIAAAGAAAGLQVAFHEMSGEASVAAIDSARVAAEQHGADAIVGLGGGKVLDVAKAVGAEVGVPCVILPTLASTDGPCSSLSVIYTDAGEIDHFRFFGRSPDLVIVDSAIIAAAPARYLVAGMADALSTCFESAAAARSGARTVAGGRPSAAALALGAQTWEIIRDHGLSARRAVEVDAVTEAVELVIEANTLHSTLGFESGGYAGAHSVHNGLTAIAATHDALHGEKVSFGILTQLVLERRTDAELAEYVDLAATLGLPVTLAQLGIETLDERDLQLVAERAVAPDEGIHHMPAPVTAAMVAAAVLGADAFARDRLQIPDRGTARP